MGRLKWIKLMKHSKPPNLLFVLDQRMINRPDRPPLYVGSVTPMSVIIFSFRTGNRHCGTLASFTGV